MNDADMGTWQYFYNADGSLRSQIDANGNKTCLEYDSLGRLKSKSFGQAAANCETINQSQNISYTYDEHGQKGYRTSMSDSSGNTKWYYDKRGRLLREDKTVLEESFTTVWSYNNADQLSYIIYPTSEIVNYTYLPQGMLDSVGEYQVGVMTDSHNRLEAAFYHANEVFAAHSLIAYEDWLTGAGRVALLSYWDEESRQYAFFNEYAYDSVGNITKISDANNGGQEQSFAYDSLNRLLSASTTAVGDGQYGQQSYSYDANTGNLNSRSGIGEYVYVYDSKPHAVVEAGSNTYQYDANGNMTRRTIDNVVWTYEYDMENHLVETKENGQTENRYIYDGDGNRVARLDANNEGTIFIGNYFEARYPAEEELISPFFVCASEGSYCTYLPIVGNTEVNELFTGRPGVSYYYSGNQRIAMRIGGEAYLLFGDHLGSSSLLVKADGTIAEKAYYLPWGGTRGEETITSTDYGYTGQMREGDIYYYGARWYDPAIGRFIQADTIVPLQVQGTQAFDRYAYVNNNPLRYTDPTGHCIDGISTFICLAIGGALVGALVDYGRQVVGNITLDGFSLNDFADVDGTSIAASAFAGGVSGVIGVGGAALSGIGFWATVGTSAAGGLVSGRVYRATSNLLNNKDIQDDLWNPSEMITNTIVGGFSGALGFGVKRITQSTFTSGDFPEHSNSRFLLRGGNNSGFAEYNIANGEILQRIDLHGPSHANIPTPHSHQAFWNTATTGGRYLNGWRDVQSFSNFKSFFIDKYIQMRK